MLAVPGIALLRHGRGADLPRGEGLAHLADLGALQVAQVVCQVGEDAEGRVELEEEAQEILGLHELRGVLGSLEAEAREEAPLHGLGVGIAHREGVVRAHGPGELAAQVLRELPGAQHRLAQAARVLGHGEAEGQGHGVLPVGAAHLGRLRFVDREPAELELDLGQEGEHDAEGRLLDGEGLGRIEYVHAGGAQVHEARDVGRHLALEDVDEGADIVPCLLFLGVYLGRIHGFGRGRYRREELRVGTTAELQVGGEKGRLDPRAPAHLRPLG